MKMKTRAIVFLALKLATLAMADPSPGDGNSLEELEGKLTRAMDELNGKDTIGIYGDMITLERVADDDAQSSIESADPLVGRIERFLNARKIQISLPNDGTTAGLLGRALGQRSIDIELRSLTQGASEGKRRIREIAVMFRLSTEIER